MPSVRRSDVSESFTPIISEQAHTLVLGTMPGKKSLQLQQYYAHPRNALWPILCALANGNAPRYAVHQELSYEQRCNMVTHAGFALWDVLARCERPGSLDGNIVRNSEIPNAIPELLAKYSRIQTVICNGRTAEALFKRHILSHLHAPTPRILSLPSTSPAMASLSLHDKYERWRDALSMG